MLAASVALHLFIKRSSVSKPALCDVFARPLYARQPVAFRKGKAIYATFGDELVVREVALSAKFWKLQVRSRFICGSVVGGQAS
jgi:hypothetical protein